MPVLVLAEHDLGKLLPTTTRIVAAAEELGPVDLLIAGQRIDDIVAAARKLAGVAHVLVADNEAFAAPTAEPLTDLLAELAEPYSHIIAASTSVGRDVIPRLAARLDLMPVTDVVRILGPNRFERPIYAGNALQTVISPQQKHLLTIRASAFRPAAMDAEARVEQVTAPIAPGPVRFVSALRTAGDLPELSTAQVVVAGGVALGSAEKFALMQQLAAALDAAVGATRAAVDAGYAPNDWQVGQTGKIIAPDLYIGVGISGALQHLAGISGAKKIVAINRDPEAPLMKLADLSLAGDLFELVPALIAELERLEVRRKR